MTFNNITQTAYGNPFKSQNGKVLIPKIELKTEKKIDFYIQYPYCIGVYKKRTNAIAKELGTESSAIENLCRLRRTVAFADLCDMRPLKHKINAHNFIMNKLKVRIHKDHVTYWIDLWDTPYILIEPYFIEIDYEEILSSQELAVFELPSNISPYCGRWSKDIVSLPGTLSYLVTAKEFDFFLKKLQTVAEKSSESLPRWNSTLGISYEY